jgi:eukaryotic-like serine/threonine-protein kinase
LGYVGTPGYQSPEHLAGKVPTEASDVFTCALMLSELLGDGHPFRGKRGDDKSYAQAVREGDFARFRLRRPIDKVGDSARVEEVINRALHPISERRPTAEELKDALFGREESKPGPEVVPPRPSPLTKGQVELLFEGKPALRLQIETMVGRQMLKPVSPDAQYFADAQYRIHRGPSGGWMVTPMPGTRNETLVDGRRLEAGMPLRAGMRIAVGNSAKGIEKLPLVVRMS